MLSTACLRWRQRAAGRGYCKPARRPSFVPRLLVLEYRTVPSTLTVLNNADNGPDSLRAAIVVLRPWGVRKWHTPRIG